MQQIRTKDGSMVSILDLTADNFACPKGEERSYHLRIEQVKFDSNTGKRLSTPRIQTFGAKEFENGLLHNLRQQGYTFEVLHDPTAWIKAHEEAEAKSRAERAAAAKAAAEKEAKERREAEKAAMKAEIIEELKAAGLLKTQAAPKKK